MIREMHLYMLKNLILMRKRIWNKFNWLIVQYNIFNVRNV